MSGRKKDRESVLKRGRDRQIDRMKDNRWKEKKKEIDIAKKKRQRKREKERNRE